MERVVHMDSIPSEFSDDPKFETSLKTFFAGDYLGSEKIYVNIDCVKPGAKSSKYHSHSLQEEFFIILSGSGMLRFNEEYFPVGPGDMISKTAGKMNTHQFINTGDDLLKILDVGTRERGDVAYYPDEDTVMFRDDRKAFRKECLTDKWSSDPNID